MAIAYERFEGEIVVDEDDIISSASEDTQSIDQIQRQLVFEGHGQENVYEQLVAENPERLQRVHELLQNSWPQKIGVIHIVWGVVVLIMGLIQVIVLPVVEDTTEKYWKPSLSHSNFYGITLWAALCLLLSGTLGVRAAIYRNNCNLHTFVSVIILEVVIFTCYVLYILIVFSSHKVTRASFPEDSNLFAVTVTAAVAVLFGFILVLLAFIQYYDEVFCGELQLCRRCVHCCLPCICPRAVSQDELLDDTSPDRPPSLPI